MELKNDVFCVDQSFPEDQIVLCNTLFTYFFYKHDKLCNCFNLTLGSSIFRVIRVNLTMKQVWEELIWN